MTITTSGQLTFKADVTAADKWGSSTFTVGPNGETVAIPAACDVVVSAQLTTASGSSTSYEPDVHTWGGTAMLDPDGTAVALDTVYGVALYNEHATLSAEWLSANFGTQVWSGTLQPLAYAMIHFPSGLAVGATASIGITGLSGTPAIRLVLFGKAA